MANKLIQIDNLNTMMTELLTEYEADLVEKIKKHTKRAMKDLVQNTKATAPVGDRTKHYRDSITSRTVRETRYGITKQWCVRGSDYRLSHLLNDGHALRNGGRYPGSKFLTHAVDRIVPWYEKAIEEDIKNG